MKSRTIAAIAFASALPAHANELEPQMREFASSNMSEWVANPVLVEAIRAQNSTSAGYSQADIDAMDQAWRAAVGTPDSATISPVMNNEASAFLRDIVESQGGVVTEIFIMDSRGLNVAASDVTSDYWQGDEAKFQETYPKGPGAVHIGDVEFDESSQAYQGQISMTVVDPGSSEVLGAITVGVNAEAFY